MTKRMVVFLALVVFLPAANAMAMCVGCLAQNCVKPRVGEVYVPRCMDTEVTDGGPAVSSCRNVASCGGCMGWSCIRADVPPGGIEPRVVLVPEHTTIEVVLQPAQAEN